MRTKGVRRCVTIRADLAPWVDTLVQSEYFSSYSHAVNWGLIILKKEIAKAEKKRGKGARP
jgi:hypothetical protein